MENGIINLNTNIDHTVIIVGAGVSGLACAHYLQKQNIKCIILEASQIYGGRVAELPSFSDYTLDLGGEEIYNKAEHPVEKRFMKIDEFEKRYPREAKYGDLYAEYREQVYKKEGSKGNPSQLNIKADISPAQFWKLYKLDPLFKFWGHGSMGTENGGNWKNISLMEQVDTFCNNELFPTFDDCHLITNKSHFQVITSGFQNILDKIRYNHVVNYIERKEDRVIIRCQNNKQFTCKSVVVTVPLKLLASRFIQFLPPLSNERMQVMNSEIAIDAMGKLNIRFKKNIFGDAFTIYIDYKQTFAWVSSAGRSKKDYIVTLLVSSGRCEEASNDLAGFVKGLLDHLSGILKFNVYDEMIDYVWKDWGREKYIQGGHSHFVPGARKDCRAIIRQNINNQIYFAGEAVNDQGRHGCINGAFDTGLQASQEIASHLLKAKL